MAPLVRGAIASTHPKRLLSRDKSISAMSLASLLASGRADEDPQVISLREELTW